MQVLSQSFTDDSKARTSSVCISDTDYSKLFKLSSLQLTIEGDKLTMESNPTLPDLMCFPNGAEEVDIIAELAPNYPDFGTLVLNDKTGSIIDSIEIQCRENPYRITRQILKRWIQGHGRGPVTYVTLVKILRKTGLNVLAKTIESSLI